MHPVLPNSQREKNDTEQTKFDETTKKKKSLYEQDELNHLDIASGKLQGVSQKDLMELKLRDSDAFFRDSYRRKLLEEGRSIKIYKHPEELKLASQKIISDKLKEYLERTK